MYSFKKTFDSCSHINGTKLKNNLTYVSSGISSLDYVIGGGLPSGSIMAVEEDVLGNYSRVLSKYFLSEGIICKHALFNASADEDPEEIIKELPQPCIAPVDDEINTMPSGIDKMKIAWRYEGLGHVVSSFGSNTNFGHHFDLSKYIDMETIRNNNITHWIPSNKENNVKGFKNGLYYDLLTNIKRVVSHDNYQPKSKDGNVLRIFIQSLGSPIWMAMDSDDCHTSAYGQDLMKFLYCLRIILRDTNAVAFITIPTHLFDDESLIKRIIYSIDNTVKLESFAGSSRETNPVYKDYHGLFHITKLSTLNSLVPFVPPSLDLAFKLRRKKFIIEKLHLPPELEESSEREQDDITATSVSCGGFKKKDIEF